LSWNPCSLHPSPFQQRRQCLWVRCSWLQRMVPRCVCIIHIYTYIYI
jgi:hypothetical protein